MRSLLELLKRLRRPRVSPRGHAFTPALSRERLDQLRYVEEKLGYTFKDPALLDRALTHKSYVHEAAAPAASAELALHYESLEFLGDAILGFVISEFLFRTYPNRTEGELSKIKSFLVSTEQLFQLSQKLGLGRFIRLSYGEEKTGGRSKKAILADLFESFTAALYLDGGMEAARNFILSQYQSRLRRIEQEKLDFKDYKSNLQEQLHILGLPEPRYRVIAEQGPDHCKEFVVEVRVNGRFLARATGKSKKEAQQSAAQLAMQSLEKGEGT